MTLRSVGPPPVGLVETRPVGSPLVELVVTPAAEPLWVEPAHTPPSADRTPVGPSLVEFAETQPRVAPPSAASPPAEPPLAESLVVESLVVEPLLVEPVGTRPLGGHPLGGPSWAGRVEARVLTLRRRVRDWLGRHPEWLALSLAAAAWVWLALALGWFNPAGGSTLLPGHHHGPVGASEPVHSIDDRLLIWVVMVVAMMLPTTVPHLRYLGFNTRTSRRQRSVALFLLGYFAVWLVPGFALSLAGATAPGWIAAAVLAAGTWELTPLKRRALRRCCRTWPVGYSGAPADAAAVEYGLRHGVVCLLVTGPAMVALMLAGHPWWATVALTGVMAAQKLLERPDRWRTMVAIGWLASGVAVAGSVLLQHT